MSGFPFASTLRADKTLAAALGFVALFGLAELGAVAFYYAARTHAAYKVSQPSTSVSSAPLPASEPATDPAENPTASSTNVTTSNVPPSSMTLADRLLRQARHLRERGDTTTALARLQEAVQADPKNANALAEMAMIYESIQLYDRSNETWRRVQELGPSAGPLYELADMKLRIGAVAPASTSASPAVVPSGADGIPEGSTFGITEVTPTQTNDPDADVHLMLRVAVKKRPDAMIDYTKVKIQVFFYDTADNNQRVVLTDAEVSYEWLTPNHNWQDSNPEILAVTYLRPKKDALTSDAALTAAASEVTPPIPGKRSRQSKPPPTNESLETGPRKYLGYIVRVYYKDQLQAVRAEPNRLLNLFPPPFTAPTQ
jgi:tetratricopeptide (TPR) repeat protein